MNKQNFKKYFAIIFSCLLLFILQNNSEKTSAAIYENRIQDMNVTQLKSTPGDITQCFPGFGWKWTYGPTLPNVATKIEEELNSENITAGVVALSYGEEDSCGNFRLYSIDLRLELNEHLIEKTISKQEAIPKIRSIIEHSRIQNLGNVQLIWQNSGEIMPLGQDETFTVFSEKSYDKFDKENINDQAYSFHLPLISNNFSSPEIIRKKIYVIVYDPILSNGNLLSDYLGWRDHNELTQQTIDFFYETSGGSLIYELADFEEVNTWPTKIDGFQYTESEYLAAYAGETPYHSPDWVDYDLIVNSPLFNICEKANQGIIDEVWIYNGPGFGFYESRLVGPNAYWYNSPPIDGQNSCERLIPIMGPNPERELDCAVHNFGHRMESAMVTVYGSWEQNRITHNWENFALVDYLSPDYYYSGCGNIHFAPNSTSDYDYGNTTQADSICDDFFNYPNLGSPLITKSPVSCDSWNCDHIGYLRYWFRHIPSFPGCSPDNKANNWWKYFSEPELPLDPSSPCD